MAIRAVFNAVFATITLVVSALAIAAALLFVNEQRLAQAQRVRFESYLRADELRQSSDDLTRLARTYVVTGNPWYEARYWEVLRIRNGEIPRPEHYERIYWDLLRPGEAAPRPSREPRALQHLMQQLGMSSAEVAALQEAQRNSDALVRTEDIAMHAMKGQYADPSGRFTRRAPPDQALAIRLMHDDTYHRQKSAIMAPIDRFYALLDARTGAIVARYARLSRLYLTTILGLLASLLVLVGASFGIIRRRVSRPILALQEQTRTVAEDLDLLTEVARGISVGNLRQSFTGRSTRLPVGPPDEIGQLAVLHNQMAVRLQEAGAAIARITSSLSERTVQLNEARQAADGASRAKSMFLANMSHEIRTPLNAVLGFAHILLRDDTLTAAQRKHIDTIARSGEHLLALINDILEISRIEAGRTTVNPAPFDLHALLADIEAMFRVRTDSRGLHLVFDRDDSVPRHVVADSGKLRQVLVNLLGNAVKFTQTGGIAVRSRARREGPTSLRLEVEVEDTGAGIPDEERDRLFRRFEQTETGRQTGSGTGLGLAISREFMRLMGGDIGVQSEVGRGSVFRFHVPIHEGAPMPDAGAPAREVIGLEPGQAPCRVLVADDQEDSRALLVEVLQDAGFEVRQVANGEEALREVDRWHPHLVLMDLRMPVMDGYRAIKRLRGSDLGRDVRVIAVSASAFEENRQHVLTIGADDFVGKPFRREDLLARIETLLPVRFQYTDPAPDAGAEPTAAEAGPAAAHGPLRLPDALAHELREAVRAADLDALTGLIDAMAQEQPEAAHVLRDLAEQYDYDAIMKAIAPPGGA